MKLPRRNFLHLVAGAATLPAISRIARAQTYPTRPVRLIAVLTAQSSPILSDAPAPSLCPDCREPMKLVKTIPRLGGLPEIFVFYCSRCKQAETKVQEQTAA
jgi:hypothetical protein